MQSEIDDIRTALKALEIINSSEKGLTRQDVTDGIRCIRENVDLIEAQQVVNLPVMTLATIARAAVRERVGHGKAGLTVIEGGQHG
ncbi:MAG: hypothetical protein ACK5SX_15025 [Sandaracinobacter sp.]